MAEETKGLNAALDELLKGKKTEEIVGPHGLLNQLTKALLERAMNAESTHHLGYEKGQAEGRGSGNSRNGTSRKTVQGDFGSTEIAVPRDRNGSFEPQILPRHERRWTGDYNEESFFVRDAYFLGANDPYKSLKTTLKAEIKRGWLGDVAQRYVPAIRKTKVGPDRSQGDQPSGR